MAKKKSKLQLAQEQVEQMIEKVNKKIEEIGKQDQKIYNRLTDIQQLFDSIRNIPREQQMEYERLKKIRLKWKQQVEEIESNLNSTAAKNTGIGAAGIGAGIAVAALGPTVAMGIATTFGVASTGTLISSLSGAAATNAALAWLGGGALAAGGGGMAAGSAFLTILGPVGWTIAAVSLASSALLLLKGRNDKNRLENIFTLISERDIKAYQLAIVEINERICRIIDEDNKLFIAINRIKTFGLDYNAMTEAQQYELGSYVNLMNSSTQLLVNPIQGLMPNYTEVDLNRFQSAKHVSLNSKEKQLVIAFANLFYKIELDDKDLHLLYKSFKNNKKFLSSAKIAKSNFNFSIIETTYKALKYRQISSI